MSNCKKKLEELAETVAEKIDEQRDGETINEWMVKHHDITVGDFLEYVRVLVANGMTFSAARAYSIEIHTDKSKIGARKYGEHQAELTGITKESHKQLLSDARRQISESRGLHYNATSDRPLEIVHEETITGFSDYVVGDYMENMNPQHHAIRVIVGEYSYDPHTESELTDIERVNTGRVEGENESPALPRYVVFFETYTGNGVIDTSKSFPKQNRRLHSVETEYCRTAEELFAAINKKFEFVPNDEIYKVNDVIETTANEIKDDKDIKEAMTSQFLH